MAYQVEYQDNGGPWKKLLVNPANGWVSVANIADNSVTILGCE